MTTTPDAVAPESLGLAAPLAHAIDFLFERKALDVTLLDLREISSATDYFVIATGTSDTHVSAIADHVVDMLKRGGVRPLNVEGQRGARWILVDYFDFVLHVFHPAARDFYQLERLWGDAPTFRLASEAAPG